MELGTSMQETQRRDESPMPGCIMESFMLERRTWALSPAGGTKGQECSKSQRDHQLRKKAATCLVVGQGQFSELETMGSEVTQLD